MLGDLCSNTKYECSSEKEPHTVFNGTRVFSPEIRMAQKQNIYRLLLHMLSSVRSKA